MRNFNLKSVEDIDDLKGKTAIVRVDLNVPVLNGVVKDDYRIKKSLATIDLLRKKNAKTLLISHFEGEEKTLRPVYEYLKEFFSLSFSENISDLPRALAGVSDGGVVLLENLRLNTGEKENNLDFSKQIAEFGDVYINEAFSASHRDHASIVGIPSILPGYTGLLFENELKNLVSALKPAHPAVLILGGAKFETKLPLVEKFLILYEQVFIGGALVNDVLVARGQRTDPSLSADILSSLARISSNPKLVLPDDVVVINDGVTQEKKIDQLDPNDVIVDVGSHSSTILREIVNKAHFVLWNGPLGKVESGFSKSTDTLASDIAETNAETMIGGGDTIAAISRSLPVDAFSFVSTGGGATLHFLAAGTLPGVEALILSQEKFLK